MLLVTVGMKRFESGVEEINVFVNFYHLKKEENLYCDL